MEEERDRRFSSDESEVEAHRKKAYTEGSEAPEEESGRREADEDSDVEAHRHKA